MRDRKKRAARRASEGGVRPRYEKRARTSLLALWLSTGCTGQYMEGVGEAIDEQDARDIDRPTGDGGSSGETAEDAGEAARPASPTLTEDWLSNEAVVALLPDLAYRNAGFRRVDRAPFASTVSPSKTIAVWISAAGYEAYTQIDPARSGSAAVVPVGTVIVREVLSAGVLETITVMLRLPDGAFPLGGDWWYASADPQGKIKLDSELGTPQVGLLERCGSCHLRRPDDDHLFGAPVSSRIK